MIETAPKTGSRRLGDCSRSSVRRRRNGQVGTTKTDHACDVDLTADLVNMLGAWWGELGSPAERTLAPGAGRGDDGLTEILDSAERGSQYAGAVDLYEQNRRMAQSKPFPTWAVQGSNL